MTVIPWSPNKNLMSRRHADIWIHPSHYLVDPYTWVTLVTKWSWSWSWTTYSNPFVQYQSVLPFWDTAISKFDHENPWSKPCVLSKVKVTFDLENSKVKVMAKVKPIGHIWGLEAKQYVSFSFRGNQTTFGWDIANSIFSWPRSNLIVTFEAYSSIDIYLLVVSWQSDHFWLRYSKFHIWPWKFKVKIMAKVKPDGHIWGPDRAANLWKLTLVTNCNNFSNFAYFYTNFSIFVLKQLRN